MYGDLNIDPDRIPFWHNILVQYEGLKRNTNNVFTFSTEYALYKFKAIYQRQWDILDETVENEFLDKWDELFADRTRRFKFYYNNMLIDWHMSQFYARRAKILSKHLDRYSKLKWLFGWEENETEGSEPSFDYFLLLKNLEWQVIFLWQHCEHTVWKVL